MKRVSVTDCEGDRWERLDTLHAEMCKMGMVLKDIYILSRPEESVGYTVPREEEETKDDDTIQ